MTGFRAVRVGSIIFYIMNLHSGMGMLRRRKFLAMIGLIAEHNRPFRHQHGEEHGNNKCHDKERIFANSQTHDLNICQFPAVCQAWSTHYNRSKQAEIDRC